MHAAGEMHAALIWCWGQVRILIYLERRSSVKQYPLVGESLSSRGHGPLWPTGCLCMQSRRGGTLITALGSWLPVHVFMVQMGHAHPWSQPLLRSTGLPHTFKTIHQRCVPRDTMLEMETMLVMLRVATWTLGKTSNPSRATWDGAVVVASAGRGLLAVSTASSASRRGTGIISACLLAVDVLGR